MILFGTIALYVAAAAAFLGLVSYATTFRGGTRWLPLARGSFGLMALGLAGMVFALFWLILHHRFEVEYVYSYSSRDLDLKYLIGSFWGGQQGTFLLWAFYGGALGLILMRTAKELEGGAMFFLLLIQGFLLAILLAKSPFATLPATPPDGRGLNPLLQDPWMVIHPPTLFVGFTAAAFPAVLAFAALVKRDFDGWIRRAFPWVLFGALILGTGLFMGGYWAYKVLGWGGYWGWDPVENTSLMPWLAELALIHTMMIQQKTGSLKRWNISLGILAFLLVVYSTFLTRSGVLGDFSVHSFLDLGLNGYLIAFNVFFAGLAIVLMATRMRGLGGPPIGTALFSRESLLFLGNLVLLLILTLVAVGTSAPLLSRIWGEPAAVNTRYYFVTILPFGILLGIFLGWGPFLAWGRSSAAHNPRGLALSALATAVSGVVLYLAGVRRPELWIFGVGGIFALATNIQVFRAAARKDLEKAGGFLAHIGIALMILGIITSSGYSKEKNLVLPLGVEREAFGYRLVYQGIRPFDNGTKNAYDIRVEGKGRTVLASPIMYFSEFNQGTMKRPAITRAVDQDLYLSPLATGEEFLAQDEKSTLILAKDEARPWGGYTFKFEGFDVEGHDADATFRVASRLAVSYRGETARVSPAVVLAQNSEKYEEVTLPQTGDRVRLSRIDATGGRVLLLIRPPAGTANDIPPDALIVEASVKPFIGVLWLGTFLVMAGFLLAIRARIRATRGPRTPLPGAPAAA